MTPNATVIHIPAGVGMDQSTREEHVSPGAANLYQQNVRINNIGELETRPGFAQITNARLGASTRAAGLRVAGYRDSIVVSDGDLLDAMAPTVGEWVTQGRLPGCEARRYPVASTGLDNVNVIDVGYGNGYYVIAVREPYGDAGAVRFVGYVVDAATRQVVYSADLTTPEAGIVNHRDVKVGVVGSLACIFYSNENVLDSRSEIRAIRIDLADIPSGFVDASLLVVDHELRSFDVHPMATQIALAYENDGGGTTRITVKLFTPATFAETDSTTITTNSAAVRSICLAGAEGEELWVAWCHTNNSNVYVSARSTADLSSVIGQTSVLTVDGEVAPRLISIGRTAAHEAYVAAAGPDAVVASWTVTAVRRIRNSSGTLLQDRLTPGIRGWVPVSKPFVYGGRTYMEISDDSPAELHLGLVVLVDVTGDASDVGFTRNLTVRPVAMAAPRLNAYSSRGSDPDDLTGCARHIASKSATVFSSVHVVKGSAVTASINITEYDFGSVLKHLPANYGGALYLSGGILYRYDGQRAYEAGFIAPPRLATTLSGTGISGTYIYTAIHEFTDSMGNVEWSAPARVDTNTPSNQTVTVFVRRPAVTWKYGYDGNTELPPQGLRETKTKIYRTPNGGGDFYLLATLVTTPGETSSYADTTLDADLIEQPKLYKAPGRVGTAKDRQAIGSCRHLVECNGVLVVVAEDGVTLRATAQRVVGEVPWHHDNLQLPLDGNGEIMGLASLDGAVVAFFRDSIYIVPVEPANDALTVGGFGVPRQIAVDCGCIEPRSIVVTGMGIFFQSDRGIEVLTRELVVAFIGEKIQRTFASYPNVTAAVLDVRNGLVRFSLAQTGSTTVGVDAVFDLTRQEWSSFDVKQGAGASAQSVSATYAKYSGGWRYIWLESDGTVHYESDSSFLDKNSTFVVPMWEPPWLKTELQREHQFWQGILLHDRQTACGITAEVAYDWQAYAGADDKVWAEAAVLAYPKQVELRTTGRYQAIKFRFRATAPSVVGTGEGTKFVGLSYDLAPHQGPTQGTPKLPVASRR